MRGARRTRDAREEGQVSWSNFLPFPFLSKGREQNELSSGLDRVGYGALFVSKLFVNVMFNAGGVTYPMNCSCESINHFYFHLDIILRFVM